MNWIPPTIVSAASSTKSVTFWVLLALWLPVTRTTTQLDVESLQWITIGFCAWVIAQGLNDFGKAATKTDVEASLPSTDKK